MKRIPAFLRFVVAGAAATLVIALWVPDGSPQHLAFGAMGAACVAMIVVGVRRNRPRHAWPWMLIASSVGLTATGYLSWGVYESLYHHLPPVVSVADAFFLPGAVCFAVGCLGFLPTWHTRDRDVLLDVGIAATAAAILLWAIAIDPHLSSPVPLDERIFVALYPLTNVAELVILIRLAVIPNRRTTALWLIVGGFAIVLVANVGYAAMRQSGGLDMAGPVVIGYLIGLVVMSAAALHPQMRRLTEPGRSSPTLSWERAVLLGAALLVAPAVLLVKEFREPGLGTAPVAVASALVAGLVLWRIVRATRERQQAESTLAYRATHDLVTGLPNRALLLDRIETALAAMSRRPTSRIAVIFLDLDAFKEVNDAFGHDVGDELLVCVAERLTRAIRPGDTVARFGGDEFVVLAETVDALLGAAAMAERVREALSEPFELRGHEIFCSASLGVTLADRSDASPENLLREADAAMYRAKEAGRDRFEFFDDSMRAAARQRVELDAELRRACERGEFVLHYQPLLNIERGTIKGVESLIRWNHPERGLVAPKEFIPAAEAGGLIVPIGWWILQEALDQAVRWREQGSPLAGITVGVNIAAAQLREVDFADRLGTMLERSGTPAEQLCIELTETALIDEVASSLGTVQELKRLGVRIALDDFGTGYSSLTYLQRFPVDELKIDISFVSGLGKDPEDDVIVAAIVAMAQKLGLDTVAEGVETIEQMDTLRTLGCTIAQGYLVARPTPAGALEAVCSPYRAERVQPITDLAVLGAPVTW